MSEVISDDYPEHLNPFDENYDPVASSPLATRAGGHKYNTWNSSRGHKLTKQPKPNFLERPWAALNISPKGKLVRRLSVLKTAVERFASKKKRIGHSTSFREDGLPPRSNSLHEEFNYRIISPKVKEKIRQQVFKRSMSTQEQGTDGTEKDSQSPQINGRLTLPLTSDSDNQTSEDYSPTSPESDKDVSQLGARPKARKKRPPPPPPVETNKNVNSEVTPGLERADDSVSANSSITQDLEKDALLTDDDTSLVELDPQIARRDKVHD